MAQLVVVGPFDESRLHDDLGPDPVRAQARQAAGARERRLRHLEGIEPRAELGQEPGIEACADLAGKHEIVAIVVADEEGAEPDAAALRIGEAADDEILLDLALHFQPVRRPPLLVARIAALGDDAFPAFGARALPGLLVVERRYA